MADKFKPLTIGEILASVRERQRDCDKLANHKDEHVRRSAFYRAAGEMLALGDWIEKRMEETRRGEIVNEAIEA